MKKSRGTLQVGKPGLPGRLCWMGHSGGTAHAFVLGTDGSPGFAVCGARSDSADEAVLRPVKSGRACALCITRTNPDARDAGVAR